MQRSSGSLNFRKDPDSKKIFIYKDQDLDPTDIFYIMNCNLEKILFLSVNSFSKLDSYISERIRIQQRCFIFNDQDLDPACIFNGIK